MTAQQFKALLDYIDERVELQSNRDTLASAYFHQQCKHLKIYAIQEAERKDKGEVI